MSKQIKDFFPEKDVKWLKSYGCARIANILSGTDEDAIVYILAVLKSNKIQVYRYLKDNFQSKRSMDEKYNVDIVDASKEFYRTKNLVGRLYNDFDLPNCFIDYIRNLEYE